MRKLAWAALAFTAAVLVRHYVLPGEWALYVMAALGVLAGLGAFVPGKKLRMGIFLVCVSALLGIARYEWQVTEKLEPGLQLVGNEYRITAELTAYPELYEDYTRLTVRLETEGLPETKMYLYDYSPDGREWKPGDRVRTLVKFTSPLLSAGDSTDTYISKGVYLRGYAREVLVYAGVSDDTWMYTPLNFGKAVRDAVDSYMTPRTSAFMKALLTGEKTDLYAQSEVYHIITRSGISHVVAVSGMHVSFVVGLMVLLFGGGWGWLISVVFAALFALMTGLSPSVVRALFMQTLFLLAPLLRREADDVTAICFPLLVLLVLNPFAIASVSLQLSFGAMWGIILVTPRAMDWFEGRGEALAGVALSAYRFVTASFAMSLGATVFTLPLCAWYFGNIAVLSPLTNLLVLWLVPVCFAGGFGVFALSQMSGALAGLMGGVLSGLVELLYIVAGWVADVPFALVYLPERLLMIWLVITYLLFAVTYFIKVERFYRPAFAGGVSVVLLIAMSVGVKLYGEQGVTVGAVDVGQGQSIVLMAGDDTLVIDCGGIYDTGERTARYLYSHGRSDVDLLVLTHFDEDHINGVADLLIQVPVKEILFCGTLMEAEDAAAFQAIQAQAERSGTSLRLLNRSGIFSCGSIQLQVFVTDEGLVTLARAEGYTLLVTGDLYSRAEEVLIQTQHLSQGDCLVVGHHGSKYSTGDVLLDAFRPECCIISCGYNSYGHPEQEVLDRLEKRNVVIYRTDESGDITLKVR